MPGTIEKVSIIISQGSLEGIYPGLIMANGARAEGIEANLFFTFFGLDAISRKRHEHIKVASVGNPGLHLATIIGGLPGMPGLLTAYMERKMGKLDIPPIPEFIEMIADTGAGIYGCQASCDLFGLTKDDLINQVTGIITVGEFYALAAAARSSSPDLASRRSRRRHRGPAARWSARDRPLAAASPGSALPYARAPPARPAVRRPEAHPRPRLAPLAAPHPEHQPHRHRHSYLPRRRQLNPS